MSQTFGKIANMAYRNSEMKLVICNIFPWATMQYKVGLWTRKKMMGRISLAGHTFIIGWVQDSHISAHIIDDSYNESPEFLRDAIRMTQTQTHHHTSDTTSSSVNNEKNEKKSLHNVWNTMRRTMHDYTKSYPSSKNYTFIGIFIDKNTFIPIALANDNGYIYESDDIRTRSNMLARVRVHLSGKGTVSLARFLRQASRSLACESPARLRTLVSGTGNNTKNNDDIRDHHVSDQQQTADQHYYKRHQIGDISLSSFNKKAMAAHQLLATYIPVCHGSVLVRNDDDQWRWTASWLSHDGCITFEQTRSPQLYTDNGVRLDYEDAMVCAYFYLYVLPAFSIGEQLISYGTSHIYRRLNSQAPLSAIRMSARDITSLQDKNVRVSGLEKYFAKSMSEVGALDEIVPLEAIHAQENLETVTQVRSRLYTFNSKRGIDFDSAIRTVQIESAVNIFNSLSTVVENNYHYDMHITEDTITQSYCAYLVDQLLENPACDALTTLPLKAKDYAYDDVKMPGLHYQTNDDQAYDDNPVTREIASAWLGQFYGQHYSHKGHHIDIGYEYEKSEPTVHKTADSSLGEQELGCGLGDIANINAVYPMVRAAREMAYRIARSNDPYAEQLSHDKKDSIHKSQWVYRQTLSTLISYLRLVLRSDIDFRADVSGTRETMLNLTSLAGITMPTRYYDPTTDAWDTYEPQDRARKATLYDLRVGIMLAALAFGASDNIERVTIRIDQLLAEQGIKDRNPTVYEILKTIIAQKDLDNNGDDSQPSDDLSDTHSEQSHSPSLQATDSVNDEEFAQLMQSVDFSSDQLNDLIEHHSELSTDEDFKSAFEEIMAHANENSHHHHSLGEYLRNQSDDSQLRIMSGPETDPLELIRRTASSNTIAVVTFEREKFLSYIKENGLSDPVECYKLFHSHMNIDKQGNCEPVDAPIDIHNSIFSPEGALDEAEVSHKEFNDTDARILGARTARDLSIQRNNILECAQEDISALANDNTLTVPERAQKISSYIDDINDPELLERKESYLNSVIDGKPIDRTRFTLEDEISQLLQKAQTSITMPLEMSFSAWEALENRVQDLDTIFKAHGRVPVYFNTSAERIVYNRLFATPGEKLVLIPDSLYNAHVELGLFYGSNGRNEAAMKHINSAIAYAPASSAPRSHLSALLEEKDDWQSSYAAARNALRVTLGDSEASFIYSRMGTAAWMQDDFDIAASCYLVAMKLSPELKDMLNMKLRRLFNSTDSQDITVPRNFAQACECLAYYDIDVWPHTPAAQLMDESAKVAIDNNLFQVGMLLQGTAANLDAVSYRLYHEDGETADVYQSYIFIRSLHA